ncbi:hypothetical protein ABW21_db0204972 [Orbilia brochopaga]|nr:hypothetical protein ABW21_db0204972 [Drechslerella brochopaga]
MQIYISLHSLLLSLVWLNSASARLITTQSTVGISSTSSLSTVSAFATRTKAEETTSTNTITENPSSTVTLVEFEEHEEGFGLWDSSTLSMTDYHPAGYDTPVVKPTNTTWYFEPEDEDSRDFFDYALEEDVIIAFVKDGVKYCLIDASKEHGSNVAEIAPCSGNDFEKFKGFGLIEGPYRSATSAKDLDIPKLDIRVTMKLKNTKTENCLRFDKFNPVEYAHNSAIEKDGYIAKGRIRFYPCAYGWQYSYIRRQVDGSEIAIERSAAGLEASYLVYPRNITYQYNVFPKDNSLNVTKDAYNRYLQEDYDCPPNTSKTILVPETIPDSSTGRMLARWGCAPSVFDYSDSAPNQSAGIHPSPRRLWLDGIDNLLNCNCNKEKEFHADICAAFKYSVSLSDYERCSKLTEATSGSPVAEDFVKDGKCSDVLAQDKPSKDDPALIRPGIDDLNNIYYQKCRDLRARLGFTSAWTDYGPSCLNPADTNASYVPDDCKTTMN